MPLDIIIGNIYEQKADILVSVMPFCNYNIDMNFVHIVLEAADISEYDINRVYVEKVQTLFRHNRVPDTFLPTAIQEILLANKDFILLKEKLERPKPQILNNFEKELLKYKNHMEAREAGISRFLWHNAQRIKNLNATKIMSVYFYDESYSDLGGNTDIGSPAKRQSLNSYYAEILEAASNAGVKSIALPLLIGSDCGYSASTAYSRYAVDHAYICGKLFIKNWLEINNSSLQVYLCIDNVDQLSHDYHMEILKMQEDAAAKEKELTERIALRREKYKHYDGELNVKFESYSKKHSLTPTVARSALVSNYITDFKSYKKVTNAYIGKEIGCSESTISRIANPLKKNSERRKDKDILLALAVFMELNNQQRYEFLHFSGYTDYPDEKDSKDFLIEDIMHFGKPSQQNFEYIDKALKELHPPRYLKVPKKQKEN